MIAIENVYSITYLETPEADESEMHVVAGTMAEAEGILKESTTKTALTTTITLVGECAHKVGS